jgi:glycosyltransferase involved in cell wall biosynthesis
VSDVSVVVATYDRPVLLAETLASILGQRDRLGQAREIVVIDNHPSQNGRPVVEALAPGAALPVRYVADPVRNMSALRNRGFTEAAGRWVAFIDDDEVAAPDWLDELLGAALETGADIAVGPRLATFAAGHPPAWDPTGGAFARDLHLPDRTLLDLTDPDGKPRYGLGTGNSVFDTKACFPNDEPAMRLEFGDAGGEDAELFVRLHRQGRRIVWAAKAFVTETVPEHRTRAAYRLVRVRREAQHYASIYLDAAPNPEPVRILLVLKGLAQVAAGFLVTLFTAEFGSERRLAGRLLMAHGAGKLTWRRPVGYISEPGSSVKSGFS